MVVNEGTFPFPPEDNPIVVFEFVQVKVQPLGTLVKLVAGTIVLLHDVIFAGTLTVGEGMTVIVYTDAFPGQVFSVEVTDIVAVIKALVLLIAVNEGIFPLPVDANPIEASELVQANVAPAGVLVKLVAATEALLQTVMFAGTATVGVGLTVIV